jgi:hypothetical protein
MLEFLLEVIGEFLLQALVEILFEFGFHALRKLFRRPSNPWVAAGWYMLFGAIFGGLSLLLFPNHLVPMKALRVANLVVTPVAVGLLMAGVGLLRARRGQSLLRIDRFAYGYLFALALAAVRFHFAN